MTTKYSTTAESNGTTDTTKCPCCGSYMTATNLSLDGDTVSADAACPTCGATCTLDFSVTNYYGLVKAVTSPAKHADTGGACPACRSSRLTRHGVTGDGGRLWRAVACDSCGAAWNDEFSLTGYAELELKRDVIAGIPSGDRATYSHHS